MGQTLIKIDNSELKEEIIKYIEMNRLNKFSNLNIHTEKYIIDIFFNYQICIKSQTYQIQLLRNLRQDYLKKTIQTIDYYIMLYYNYLVDNNLYLKKFINNKTPFIDIYKKKFIIYTKNLLFSYNNFKIRKNIEHNIIMFYIFNNIDKYEIYGWANMRYNYDLYLLFKIYKFYNYNYKIYYKINKLELQEKKLLYIINDFINYKTNLIYI